jgi:hypothetical protein
MNIDRIAREMVDVEPSVDLEARIRARLDAVRPGRHAAWWTWRVAAPLGALVAVALAIGVLVSRGPGVVTSVGVQSAKGLPAEAAPAGAVAQAGPEVVNNIAVQEVRSLPAVAAPAGAVAKAGQLSSEEIAWMERRMPALDPVNPLQVDHLRVDAIQPEPLAITPLTMTPVATEGGGIERRNDR